VAAKVKIKQPKEKLERRNKMPEKNIKITPVKYRHLLGKEVKCFGRMGFIAAIHPELGITVKPLHPTDKDDDDSFVYCFAYDVAVKEAGKNDADLMFLARIAHLENNDSIDDEDLTLMDCALGHTHLGAGTGSCPFSE
jgi:hypothetical protein